MFAPSRSRTLTSIVLRTLVPRLVVFGAAATVVVLGQAIAVDPSAHYSDEPVEQAVAGPPTWTGSDAAAYPECVPSASWPAGTPAGFLVVHSVRDDARSKLAFDDAWALNHNDIDADDVWVVGVCG